MENKNYCEINRKVVTPVLSCGTKNEKEETICEMSKKFEKDYCAKGAKNIDVQKQAEDFNKIMTHPIKLKK